MPDVSRSTHSPGHPWSLDFFLDAGANLACFPRLGLLAEEVLVHRAHDGERERRSGAFEARVAAVEVFSASDGEDPMSFSVYYLWLAELLEDKAVLARFRDALDPEIVARCDGLRWGVIDPEDGR